MSKIFAQDTDCSFLIEQAVKAPSGHNTQPWTFRIKETGIDVLPDFTKTLPVVDPDNRELFVSLGCATENFCVAAAHKGYETMVSIAENGTIHIELTKQDSDTPSPLFPHISVRQTNRSVYDGNTIPVNDIVALGEKSDMEPCVGVHFFKNGTREFDAISEMVCEGNSIQMRDKKFKEELQQWMRYNKKHQDATRDGLSYAVFGAPNLSRFIAKAIITRLINEKSQNRNDRRKIASSSHFVLFTTSNNTVVQWIKLGRALEHILLKATGMGISHAYMNQPNEVQGLSRKMAEILGIEDEYPTVLIRLGYGSKMPYSLRRSVQSCIIPNSFD